MGRRPDGNLVYQTSQGQMFCGRTEDVLQTRDLQNLVGKVQLVFTSPPYPLQRVKKYGNLKGDAFAAWLAEFAAPLRDLLTSTGSIVIELGNGWNAGEPTISTASLKALLAFQEAGDLRLCQEFICYNPSKLPTPAEWVTVRRIRVKDSFTRVWWMASTAHPKADNRRVLTEYSSSMKKLLKQGTMRSYNRPSQHQISEATFQRDNGGAIPANVLVPPEADLEAVLPIANTRSRDAFMDRCRAAGHPSHPARMPEALAEFFVRFLTDPDDLVLDPFAGSNTTGAVAERLGRRWLGIEADAEYAAASQLRFSAPAKAA